MKTKKEAAEFLEVSEKAIERYVAAGKLSKHVEKKEGGGMITYYQEKELEKLKKVMKEKVYKTNTPRQVGLATALVSSKPADLSSPIYISSGLHNSPDDFLSFITTEIEQRKQKLEVDITKKIFLTLKEAAALSGLSVSHFEFAIKSRKLKVHNISHVRGRRIKRTELDIYVKKL